MGVSYICTLHMKSLFTTFWPSFQWKSLLSSHPMGVSNTEYLTLIRTLGCLTRSLGVNEGHQLEGKVNWPRHVPSLPLSLSEHIWLLSSLFSWSLEAVSWMQICELWCLPTTLWWFPVWKSTRKTGSSLGIYKTSWCTILAHTPKRVERQTF